MTYTPPTVGVEVTVTSSATQIGIVPTSGSGSMVNAGQLPAWYGTSSGVTVGTGTLLAPGATAPLSAGTTYWAITNSGTSTVVMVSISSTIVGGGGTISALMATTFGATFNGVTDDTTALQNAINATPTGGTLILPYGTAKISSPLTINKSMTLMGSGIHPVAGSVITDFNTINLPTASPYITGSVIRQDTAATDALQITGAGVGVDLRDFGILFGTSIIFVNTGHGINMNPPAANSQQDNGVLHSHWENLIVMGHDGNHYGYVMTNPICCQFDMLRAWGGGTVHIINNGVTSPSQGYYGNSQFNSLYGQVFCNGSAHGIYSSSTTNFQNLLVFVRPQVTVSNMTSSFPTAVAPTSAQLQWKDDGLTQAVTLVQPDFETTVGSGVQLPLKTFNIGTVGWLGARGNPITPGGESITTWLRLAQLGIFLDTTFEYRADQITGVADATAISSWPDSSGNGYTLSQVTGTAQPIFYKTTSGKPVNGLPAVWFDGTDDYMSNTSVPTITPPYTLVAVGIYSVFTGGPYMLANVSSNAVGINTSATPNFGLWAGTADIGGGTPTAGATYVQVGCVNGTSSYLRANGVVMQSGASPGTNSWVNVRLGASPAATPAQFLTGAVCHAILFPYALQTQQCVAIEAYLTNKWA